MDFLQFVAGLCKGHCCEFQFVCHGAITTNSGWSCQGATIANGKLCCKTANYANFMLTLTGSLSPDFRGLVRRSCMEPLSPMRNATIVEFLRSVNQEPPSPMFLVLWSVCIAFRKCTTIIKFPQSCEKAVVSDFVYFR